MRGQRDPGLERAWRRRVERQPSSGLSVRAFCERHEVAESAFYFWRRELARRDAESRANHSADAQDVRTAEPPRRRWLANGPSPFVPITISESVEPTSRTTEPASTGWIELVHPGGIVIRVPAGCELAVLRPMLDLLDDRERGGRSC